MLGAGPLRLGIFAVSFYESRVLLSVFLLSSSCPAVGDDFVVLI